MALAIVPIFQSSIATDPAATAAGYLTPSRWNQGMNITGQTNNALFYTDGSGNFSQSSNLTFNGTTLTNSAGGLKLSGQLSFIADGTYDIGQATTPFNRPRNLYISNNIEIGGAWNIDGAFIRFSPSQAIEWNGDTGIARNAAGVVEINNFTAGTFRDLKLRNLSIGSALATNQTDGFINIAGAAGPATGTPNNTTGVPIYYDTTNNKLMAYNGGWKTLATAFA